MFCKRLSLSLVLVFQIAALIVLTQFMIGKMNYVSFNLKEFSSLSQESGFYFCPVMMEDNFDYSSVLRDIKSILTIGRTGFKTDSQVYPLKIYEDQLLQYYTPQLGKGNWLGDINSENDALPAICSYANSSIKMGDVLTGEILDVQTGTLVSLKINIIGELAAPNISMDFGISGNGIKISDLFMPASSNNQPPDILVSKSQLAEFCNIRGEETNILILFNSSASSEENAAVLRNYGSINRLEDIVQKEREDIGKQLRVLAPYLVMLLLMILLGLIGLSLLSIMRNMRDLAIYYIVGCSRKRCISICLYYMLMISGFAFIISAPVDLWLFSAKNRIIYQIFPAFSNVFSILCLLCIMAIISVIGVMAAFRKFSTIQLIHGKE